MPDTPETTEPITKQKLAGAWCKGFNAFHAGRALEACPRGNPLLMEQWRAGWSDAQKRELQDVR